MCNPWAKAIKTQLEKKIDPLLLTNPLIYERSISHFRMNHSTSAVVVALILGHAYVGA